MSERRRDIVTDYRLPGRFATAGLVVTCVFVVMFVVAAPLAAARPMVSDGAPYTGAHAVASHSPLIGWTCSSLWAWLTGPHGASSASGAVYMGSSVCATGPAPGSNWTNYPHITTTEGLLGPTFTANSSGLHKVVYDWQLSWNASGTSTRGSFAAIGISLIGGLFDKTTGVWLGPGGTQRSTSTQVYFHRGHDDTFSAGGVDQRFSLQFTVTLTGGDQYQFYTALHTSDTVYAPTWCAPLCHYGTGNATLNINSGGDGATILSMSVK
jgi:hypothetical protein